MGTNKLSKKGRNPGAVDSWLDTLGYYRKNVAYDETCLFRAISEQLFNCQIYHERVRAECISYARKNYHQNFFYLMDTEEQWQEHLNKLEKHMIICGNIEIQIIGCQYNRDVLVFDAGRQQLQNVTKRDLPDILMVCLMGEDHYDAVYQREHIVIAGYCQSLIYKILYENVFEIPNVDDIVHGMLYEKTYITTQAESLVEELANKLPAEDSQKNDNVEENTNLNDPDLFIQNNDIEINNNKEDCNLAINELVKQLTVKIAPFPFKVAKALDPTIYRNIEYDSWTEVRREMRLGDWYYGDDKLILGTRCILNDTINNEVYDCYIQEILQNQNKCIVYITKLAQRRTVNYTDLSPEDDAKPWPLPYRFSKNLTLGPTLTLNIDKATKSPRKKKDKKRFKSCSESSAHSNSASHTETGDHDIHAYVGIPLQMQNPQENQEEEITPLTMTQPSEVLLTPDVQGHPTTPRFQWDNQCFVYPGMMVPTTPEPFSWPQTPTTPHNMFNYSVKPMVASVPVSPATYDIGYPCYFNYPMETYTYSSYPTTPNYIPETPPQYPMAAHGNASSQTTTSDTTENNGAGQNTSSTISEVNTPMQMYQPYVSETTHYGYTTVAPNSYQAGPVYETHSITNERPTLCTTMTPASPAPMGLYSPVPVNIPSGTPVIYAATPEMTGVILPGTPIQMYTNPMSPQAYPYPPTPPATWYPAGIDSQGFIFPPAPQSQNASK